MTELKDLKLVIGPVPYLWSGEKWRDFHYRIADSGHVDAVTLGEVVCSKRDHFTRPFLDEVVERLETAGKSVALASLALVTQERETAMTRKLVAGDRLVEANDLSALRNLAGKPHIVGPFVNVYNGATAGWLAKRGATRICLGPELPVRSIAGIVAGAPAVDYEVFAFGRVPLAISARCAHARSKGHIKDNCQFVCGDDPDGLDVDTLDGQPFLTINGVQTMSRHCLTLLSELGALAQSGVTHLRLSPQDCDMAAVAKVYADVRDARMGADDGLEQLRIVYPLATFSNGFAHGRAGVERVA